jgi:hypothetical protein
LGTTKMVIGGEFNSTAGLVQRRGGLREVSRM